MSDNTDQIGFTEVDPPEPLPPYVPPEPYTPPEQPPSDPPSVPVDDTEPQLDTMIRFEAGEVDDLVAFMKRWVEWRLVNAPAPANDEASPDSPAA